VTAVAPANARNKRRRVFPPLLIVGLAVAVLLVVGGAYLLWGTPSGATSGGEQAMASATAALDSGDFAAAQAALEALLAADGDDLDARRALARALAAQGKNEEAIEQYAAVVEADPADHASLYEMAMLEQLLGRAAEAIGHLEAAAAIEQSPSYLGALAPIYVTVGEWAEAVAAWQKYLATAELDEARQAQVHAAIATALEGAREYEKAKDELGQAVFLDPNNQAYKARLEGYGD